MISLFLLKVSCDQNNVLFYHWYGGKFFDKNPLELFWTKINDEIHSVIAPKLCLCCFWVMTLPKKQQSKLLTSYVQMLFSRGRNLLLAASFNKLVKSGK